MSLESELYFEISRCSLCPLGASHSFCAPAFDRRTDTFLVMESPDQRSCDEGGAWRHQALIFLAKALAHACGPDLGRFHPTFLLKCQAGARQIAQRDRLRWAQTCSTQYLAQEIKAIKPRRILLFGESAVRICLPDLEDEWSTLIGRTWMLPPYDIETVAFENPLLITRRGGLASATGRDFIERLHRILGGVHRPPQAETGESGLFGMLAGG